MSYFWTEKKNNLLLYIFKDYSVPVVPRNPWWLLAALEWDDQMLQASQHRRQEIWQVEKFNDQIRKLMDESRMWDIPHNYWSSFHNSDKKKSVLLCI